MSDIIHTDPSKRHDFVFLFDVSDGNPNGDPDAGNLPRVDPETMQGLVTDVSIKRKIRDWVDLTHGSKPRFNIYVQNSGVALNTKHKRAFESLPGQEEPKKLKDQAKVRGQEEERRQWMCHNFYDVRTFGAVMSTGDYPCGQVRGPIQLTFARSINPIVPLDLSITRVAITQEGTDKKTEMGRKAVVPYALYLGRGFFTPHFASQTSFTAEDLALFWQALQQCWDLDHSASRGMLALRGLYIFTHEHPLGNAPAHALVERVSAQLKAGITTPRRFSDYEVRVQTDNPPSGVTLTRLVEAAEVPAPVGAHVFPSLG